MKMTGKRIAALICAVIFGFHLGLSLPAMAEEEEILECNGTEAAAEAPAENAGMTDETEALLYAASRAQHVREVIRPAVKAGKVVLCDRFVDSSAAYQGGGRQMGIEKILQINAPAVDGTLPDLTVYLDIDHRTAMARRCAATEPDRMEMEAESFHARVEDGYHELIRRDPKRFAVVNAEGDRDSIAAEVSGKVLAKLLEMEK